MARKRNILAITLTELLVVIAILGLLATGVVPTVSVLLSKAEDDDVKIRLGDSWRTALALTQSRQQPVIWMISADESSARIEILDDQYDRLWSTSLKVSGLQIQGTGQLETNSKAQMIIYPHGLSSSLKVTWQTGGGIDTVVLPPDRATDEVALARQGQE